MRGSEVVVAISERTAPWWQRVVPVTGLVLGALALAALVVPGFRHQLALSASHRTDAYVELYFARTPAGTQQVCTTSGGRADVRFAVTSHLAGEEDLAYDVTVGDEERSGTVTVRPGASSVVLESLPRPSGPYDVRVQLFGSDQQLQAHCPGARS
ncbi:MULTISPECIES: hypothetical protein [unclassified Nocardioides]|uniref:hypothetical protein n=1 Tax=unclassified Nocardioides TaxID=2615069 RepID=UPI001056D826|nr:MULTISPECIES: hypothetical protein [unclassified Nocardioides]